MSVDVSPDGASLVFDLLGDIYVMPAAGGEAVRLTTLPKLPAANARVRVDAALAAQSGQPLDVQPRFSPDGKRIVFVSDRDGADNVYVMNVDGTELKQISFGRDMHTSPTWSPDGKTIAVRRVTARPNAFVGSAGVLVLYPVNGGNAVALTRTAETHDVSGMEYDADGSGIYISVPVDPVRNEIPHGRTFQLKHLDLKSKTLEDVTDNFGGALRPRVSADGKLLTYATFSDGEMVLRVRELTSTAERDVVRGIELSSVIAGLQLDALPGYGISRDGRYAFLSYGGQIHRVSLSDGATQTIPMHVHTQLQVGPRNYFAQTPWDKRMPVRMLNWPQFTPDRKHAVFEAIGKIWVVDGAGGQPRRLTSSSAREYAPSISPDGKQVAYVTWSDTARGQVRVVPIGGGASRQITRNAGYYANPNWSLDGSKLVVIVGGNAELRGLDPTQDRRRSLAWIDLQSGELHTVISTLSSNERFGGFQDIGAHFNRDGTRLWYVTGDGSALHSVGLDGRDDREHFTIADPQYQVATYIAVSPDEQRVAFTGGNDEVWMMPLPTTEKPRVVNVHAEQAGVVKLSAPAGYAPRWIDNNTVSWGFGNKLFRRDVDAMSAPTFATVALQADVPSGKGVRALVGARLITMRGDEVIENGTIVIRDNRIIAVGKSNDVTVPAGATVTRLDGRTILPGFFDLHDHGFGGSAIHNWPEVHRKAAAKLAYGVTFSRDLSAPIQSAFSITELINSGQMPGPRAYAAGEPVLPAIVEIRTHEDAVNTVQMMKDLGAVVLKEYMQPTRYQRQLVGEAAREVKLMITAEGGLDFKNNLSMLMDGYTATEHMWAPFPLYRDVGQLMKKTEFFYTPTIGTSASGSEHWYAQMPVDTDPKQQRFILHSARESLARRVKLAKIAPEWNSVYDAVVQSVARLASEGATVATGSHDVPTPSGLGLHWEIWSYVEGGMRPIDALRCATLNGAREVGMQAELGSLEPGKLADLLILTANPLENIRNTLKLTTVMLNGRALNADTLEPIE